MKRSSVRIIGIPKGVEKERGLEEIFEQIIDENFPNLAKETSIHVQKAERNPPWVNNHRLTPCHIIVQFTNIRSKNTVLKMAKGKKILTYRGENIGITSDLSTETWQARKVGRVFSKLYLRRTCSQRSFIQQGCHSELMER